MEHEHGPTSWLLQIPFLPHDPFYTDVNASIVLTVVIGLVSLGAYLGLKGKEEKYIVPGSRLSLVGFIDLLVEGVYNMIHGVLGHETRKYFSFVAAVFLYVLFGNLFGMIPFSSSPTGTVNTTYALGLCSFVVFNAFGVRAHGLKGYLAHFLMGLGPAGIFVAVFEIISILLRPVTLGLRLYLNIFIDHNVVHTFQGLVAWVVPVPLLLFGIVVCTIQAFVFATLTAVYIQMATEHEHESHGAH